MLHKGASAANATCPLYPGPSVHQVRSWGLPLDKGPASIYVDKQLHHGMR